MFKTPVYINTDICLERLQSVRLNIVYVCIPTSVSFLDELVVSIYRST